jgi:hypothetical protein
MSRRVQDNIVALIILVIFVAAIIASMEYGPRARLVPIPIAALGAVLVILQLIFQNLRPDTNLQVNLLEVLTSKAPIDAAKSVETIASPEVPAEAAKKPDGFGSSDAKVIGIVALLIGMIILLGPYAAMFLFTAGYFIASRQYAVPKALLYALGYSILCYLIFTVALDVQFERSIVGMGLF